MLDMDALVNELSNNPRYDDSVRRGDNTLTTELLHDLEPGKTLFLEVDVRHVGTAECEPRRDGSVRISRAKLVAGDL